MSAASPATRQPLRRLVAAFLLMAYAFGWTIQLAAFQFGLSFRLGSSIAVIFGLALPAFLVTAAAWRTPGPPSWRCSELSYTSPGEDRDGRPALPGSWVIMAGLRRD
jgi:hypothetical protein